jgi:undecaprenyl-phosphate 4-deoxy-4-formamido-L-arabinose transferase
MKLISAVVPVFNEEVNLNELIDRCLAVGEGLAESFELVLVDDGSRDRSAEIISEAAAKNPGVVIGVLLKRNYGQHSAVMAGFSEARGDLVVTLDGDLQNPPEEIPKLVAKYHEGCEVVGSIRVRRQDSLFRRVASKIVNAAARKATGVSMHDYGCMLRAYDRSIVEAMLNSRERSTFIPVLANSFASRTGEVEVAHSERSNDESKYGMWKLINLQFDLLTTMTTAPLRLLSVVGGSLAFFGFAFAILLIVTRFVYGAAWAGEGIFTLFAVLFVFVGLQLMGLGLVGEYIGRIYHDVRGRPRYVLREVLGRE